jgi:hypothetical protein
MTIDNETVSNGTDDAALFAEMTSADLGTDQPEVTSEPVVETKAPTPQAPIVEPVQEREPVRVPLNELIEERRQRQALERQMTELVAAMKANQPAPPPVQQPEIWDNPREFVQAEMSPALERQQQAMMYNARLIAEARFGEQSVKEAQEAFDALVASGSMHPADYQKVMQSPNPFAEGVKWHQAHKIVSEVGTDPTAYKAKLRSELLNDPEFRKEMMAQLQQQAGASPMARQAPSISLPSLSRVGATALPSKAAEMDDASLWNDITAPKRR